MSDFSIYHIHYVMATPHPDKNDLDSLFRLLDSLDVFERDRALTWIYLAFLEAPARQIEAESEEERLERRYNNFEEKFRHAAQGMLEPFLVHATVTHTLAHLRECGDKACLNDVVHKLQSALHAVKRQVEEGALSPEAAEAMQGNLEEHINNLHADVELARHRYEAFCEKVVKMLLP